MLRSALQPSKLVAETLAMSAATLALDRASSAKPVMMACVVRGAWCVVRGAWCVVRGSRVYPPQVEMEHPSVQCDTLPEDRPGR